MKKLFCFGFLLILCIIGKSQIIVEDDFSSNKNKWTVSDKTYFQNQRYHIFNKETGWRSYLKQADLMKPKTRTIQVDTYYESGITNLGYGLMFRAADIDNAFIFLIVAQGYYSLGKLTNGSYTKILDWTFSEKITKNGKNQMIIKFTNSKIIVFVNNQELFKLSDIPAITESIAYGGIGFYSSKEVHASFDMLKVWDEQTLNEEYSLDNFIAAFKAQNINRLLDYVSEDITDVIEVNKLMMRPVFLELIGDCQWTLENENKGIVDFYIRKDEAKQEIRMETPVFHTHIFSFINTGDKITIKTWVREVPPEIGQ